MTQGTSILIPIILLWLSNLPSIHSADVYWAHAIYQTAHPGSSEENGSFNYFKDHLYIKHSNWADSLKEDYEEMDKNCYRRNSFHNNKGTAWQGKDRAGHLQKSMASLPWWFESSLRWMWGGSRESEDHWSPRRKHLYFGSRPHHSDASL